jgi:regulator of protease activity HflC (stomatin/prohibitin superfamily)
MAEIDITPVSDKIKRLSARSSAQIGAGYEREDEAPLLLGCEKAKCSYNGSVRCEMALLFQRRGRMLMKALHQSVSRASHAPGTSMLILAIALAQCLVLFWPVESAAQNGGHLGVFIQNLPRATENTGPPREGVLILGLMRNSPAEQGGLKRGDIILKFDGQPVHQVEDLQRLLGATSPDEIAEIEVLRRDQTLTLPMKIAPIPASLPGPPPESVPPVLQRDGMFWLVLAAAGLVAIVIYFAAAGPWQHWRPIRSAVMVQISRMRLSHYQVFFAAAGLLLVVLLWSSLIVVEPGHRGVVFHLFRGVQQETLGEGVHVRLTGLHVVTIYDTRSRAYQVRNLTTPVQRPSTPASDQLLWTPTADGLKVGFDLSVRYRLDPSRLAELHRSVGPEFEAKLVHPSVWNITRLVASEYSLLDIYGKRRHDMQQQALSLLQGLFARDGLIGEDLLLRDIVYTKEFERTLVEKMVAEQQVEEAIYEVQQAELRAQVQVIEAQGEAQALELVNRSLQDQPLLLKYFWIKSLPERLRVVVMPNRTGK